MGNLGEKEKENAINEVRILASIKHPCRPSEFYSIIMELADDGDIYQKIQKMQQAQSNFQENEVWKILIQVIFGLKALHDLNIMHRDIKSANVFTNKDGKVKLGDMNVSKVASREGLNYTQTGTPYYARDEPYTFVSDIWSVGCVLYELLTLKPPFQSTDMGGLYKKVLKGHYSKIPMHYSSDLSIMLKQMLQVKQESRPNCDQLLSHVNQQKQIIEQSLTNKNINLPQIGSLKSIKAKDNSPSVLNRVRRSKKSLESQNLLLLKNKSMDMYGITEDNDDILERDYFADPILNNSSNNLNNINSNKHIAGMNIKNSPIETPQIASQFEISIQDDTYAHQRELHKRILLGKPIKHNNIKNAKKNKMVTLQKPQLMLPQSKKNSSLMYEEYVKSYKIPSSILTPLQDNLTLQQSNKMSQNLSINDRIAGHKESIGMLPKIQNEKTRNLEYQDTVSSNNKYRYQSESSASGLNNYKKSSVLIKNHAYQHQQLHNNSLLLLHQTQNDQSHLKSNANMQGQHSASLTKSSKSVLLKNQIQIVRQDQITSNGSFKIPQGLSLLEKQKSANATSNENPSKSSLQLASINREFKGNLYQNIQYHQSSGKLSKNFSKENSGLQSAAGIGGMILNLNSENLGHNGLAQKSYFSNPNNLKM
ncbi:protein kinase domain containing protein [Stylonychia lemnae]|uniref:non-specific serine/threonine protein kinase n=1 Tax=Stylonychia lemnae TaxID=5949 RepID=A0A078B319_STYLE|nr:protein kinase domain containing protein [Stylonychia lemnae]|eukprot:CDW88661.1 protein kinase domain containing protein [Stylonychia lemnae]